MVHQTGINPFDEEEAVEGLISSGAEEPPSILLVDDDVDLCALLQQWLILGGCEVRVAHSANEGLDALETMRCSAVCLDLNLPGMKGLEALDRIRQYDRFLPVVITSARREIGTVVKAMQLGAFDYLVKPLEEHKFLTTVRKAFEHHLMSVRLQQLEREVSEAGTGFAGIIGNSPPMRKLFRELTRLADSGITVLIQGESGVGKELIARAIHETSVRRDKPFVALNCACVPEGLQESELFGHEKGAFTGATGRRIGKVEQARGGTLFLDEISELDMGLQAKLLRVLQERSFERVGGTTVIDAPFRLLAASNKSLEAMVKQKQFRQDLYYRVAVYQLHVPPLRERIEDIPLLCQRFLADLREREGRGNVDISPQALELLMAYQWPGNVRELQNCIARAALVAEGPEIGPWDLPQTILESVKKPVLRDVSRDTAVHRPVAEPGSWPFPSATLDQIEQMAIEAAMKRSGGNLAQVVRELDIARSTLYRKLNKYGFR